MKGGRRGWGREVDSEIRRMENGERSGGHMVR